MFLAIDIGNSNIKLGLHNGSGWQLVHRINSKGDPTNTFFRKEILHFLETYQIPQDRIKRIVASCVVPRFRHGLEEIFSTIFPVKTTWVGPAIYPMLDVTIMNPDEIGTDLVANVVGAHHLYQGGKVIIDFGTALTFTTVNPMGEILGVSIAPGLKTAMRALFKNAAQLPEVPLEYPASVIGKDTVHAIQSGILVGYVGLVRHKIEVIRQEIGERYQAVATGGLSRVLKPLKGDFDVVNKELTLEGLRIIGQQV